MIIEGWVNRISEIEHAITQLCLDPDSINNFMRNPQQSDNTELKTSQLDRIEQKLDKLLALLEQK